MTTKHTNAKTTKRTATKNRKSTAKPASRGFFASIKKGHAILAIVVLVFLSLSTVGLATKWQWKVNAASAARVVSTQQINPRTLDLSITSPSIDMPIKKVRLLLPAGWTKDTTQTWPTLWLLHGGGGNYEDWTKNTDIAKVTADKGVIVVMPDTSWCSGYSDWWNYGKYGAPAWETYLTSEVRTLLETSYHANTERAIAGLSMGGLGALKLPAAHPGMFSAAASFSGNVDPLHSYDNTKTGPDKPGQACLADWKKVWGDYTIPAQKAIWQKNNPYDQAQELASLKYLYISDGDGKLNPLKSGFTPDFAEQEVNRQGQALVKKLEGLGIPVTSHFYSGTHTWPYWQTEMHSALPGLLQAIGVE